MAEVCAWVVLGCVVYAAWVMAVYPMLLRRKATVHPRAVQKGAFQPSVTAVVPAYNGAKYVAAKLESILTSDYPAEKLDVLLLADGCSDGTEDAARSYTRTGRVRVVSLPRGGKAAALNYAIGETGAEVLLLTDVRQRLAKDCVARLMENLHDPAVGVVSGDLQILGTASSEEVNVGIYWRYESWIRSNLGRYHSLLGATGPIYAMRRNLARPIPTDSLLDDVWLPMQAVLAGYRSVWEERAKAYDYPTALTTEFHRKVRTQAGIYQLLQHEPRLLTKTNHLRWQFVNLKLGRLFLPHVMLLLLVASFGLTDWRRGLMLTAQAGFFALALADAMVPEGTIFKRLTSIPRAVATLLAAAFCAQRIFFVPPARLWKVTYAAEPAQQSQGTMGSHA